ncbi:uncharacterized protein LOC123557137 [Mercenaria mercenaria]|uniref:uncharacterized protein LOC123557137 n=1 Tax=Mercenaria mercenaria TaxID=6596 RepID=UPI00234ED391|nr:uncharacterized protein LOC123557137 [Mercenaria mercenaria]
MALTKGALELLFDRLHHNQNKYIPGILQDAIDEYRMLAAELDREERRKVNYIRSMIEYCSAARWGLARNQLEPAEEEYYRYFFRKLTQAKRIKRSPVALLSGLPSDQRRESKSLDPRKLNTRQSSGTHALQKVAATRPASETIQKSTRKSTDLSDLSTIQKITQKFEEIYKNEWADALDELEHFKINERDAITCLLKVVLDAYRVCTVEADSQIAKLENAASSILLEGVNSYGEKPEGRRSYLMEYRRGIAYVCGERLQETFIRRYLPEIIRSIGVYQKVRIHGPVHKYASQCVAICWAMAIIDPQVYVVDDRDKPRLFNRELYKTYSNSGLSVDYYVWPPLFSHKGGKLLSKGIAQGH